MKYSFFGIINETIIVKKTVIKNIHLSIIEYN